jgi:lysylphosphatidylglycerol synthetase-like protein (DUF2156 family)
MNNIIDFLKRTIVKFLNILVVCLVLFLGLSLICINGVFVANIANSLRLTGYIDPSIGIQFVLVILSIVWLPIILIQVAKR